MMVMKVMVMASQPTEYNIYPNRWYDLYVDQWHVILYKLDVWSNRNHHCNLEPIGNC
jgi:hypothetical protein